jgi:hypothetical protein
MRNQIFKEPLLQAACVLCFVMSIGFWVSLLWPEHPIMLVILTGGAALTACSFCLGMPLPPLWIVLIPFFWLFYRLVPFWEGWRPVRHLIRPFVDLSKSSKSKGHYGSLTRTHIHSERTDGTHLIEKGG